ncbi:MAG: DNA repair protein RecN [Syntrophales bacterium]|nr:DNA repair protein RecN [Syntrophales bacterium]
MGRHALSAMLNELYIENFAIIDSLRIQFSKGMNVLSGETGAGKSIIVGAVSMLLGDRASGDMIRSAADTAVVEAQFDLRDNHEARKILEELDMEEDGELVIKRVISRSGKNRILVNGRLATAGMLSSISETLVNICGQHEHQVLLKRDNHIDILDEFAGLTKKRDNYSQIYGEHLEIEGELEMTTLAAVERSRREELIRFQLDEIDKSGIRAGEDRELADEKRLIANAGKLRELAGNSYGSLYGSEGSILEELDRVRGMTKEIRSLDSGIPIDEGALDSIYFTLEDTALSLRDYLGGIYHDPGRLQEIDDRLELLGILKRKYGGSLESILEKKESLAEELESMEHIEEKIKGLKRTVDIKKSMLESMAADLSKQRKEAARALERAVKAELKDLRMPNTTFAIIFSENNAALHGKGFDHLEFYLSTNPGEPLKPLNRVASGGELSRIVLALKKVLVRDGSAETVIFDEVDSGIGGAAAEIVGAKLRDISQRHQVLCITHLPQIASFAGTHFLVAKDVADDRTMALVKTLNEGERVEEIARMLGGVEMTEKTREHAREMLRASQAC